MTKDQTPQEPTEPRSLEYSTEQIRSWPAWNEDEEREARAMDDRRVPRHERGEDGDKLYARKPLKQVKQELSAEFFAGSVQPMEDPYRAAARITAEELERSRRLPWPSHNAECAVQWGGMCDCGGELEIANRARGLEQESKAVQDVVRGSMPDLDPDGTHVRAMARRMEQHALEQLGTDGLEQPSTSPSDATSAPVSDVQPTQGPRCLQCWKPLTGPRIEGMLWCSGRCFDAWAVAAAAARKREQDPARVWEALWDIAYFGGGASPQLWIGGTHDTYHAVSIGSLTYNTDNPADRSALIAWAKALRDNPPNAPRPPAPQPAPHR